VREAPTILESALTAAGIDHDIKVYPEAGHGFLNEHQRGDLSCLDRAIAKLAAAGYHEARPSALTSAKNVPRTSPHQRHPDPREIVNHGVVKSGL